MSASTQQIEQWLRKREYAAGFVTDIESDTVPPGLSEDVIRLISLRKEEPEWLLEFRLKAYRRWLKMTAPDWAKLKVPPIDFQAISYYSQPKSMKNRPQSLDEVDPKLLETYNKLGIPLAEQKMLAGVAMDVVFDSVSVATTFRAKLQEAGVIFCPISEAVREHPDLVRKYLGSVVPFGDNFYAALNSAVFTDGSFVFIPKGVRCPMELSTYFRINERNTGQFERTLIIAEEGSHVSYLEGCTAPQRDENQLHAAVVELVALDDARINTRRCRTGIRATNRAAAASTTSSPSAATAAVRARTSPGPRSKPARRSPGNTPPASCAATTRSASSTRSRSPTAASRRTPAPR
jgi:Iron-regulated ABC transporter membrane component SufB